MGIDRQIIHGIDLLGDAANTAGEEVLPDTVTTGGPATAQAPTPTEMAPATTTGTDTPAAQVEPMAVEAPADAPSATPVTPAPAVGTLPADYLRDGYYKGEGKIKYPNPVLVDHAEAIGKALAAGGVTPTAFNRMVKVLKGAAKLPFPGQQGALKKLLPLALKEKKPLLREVVEKNQKAVQTEADYVACLDHFRDIGIFLEATKAS